MVVPSQWFSPAGQADLCKALPFSLLALGRKFIFASCSCFISNNGNKAGQHHTQK